MAKNPKTTTAPNEVGPRFEPRTEVTLPSLVVDSYGIAWWVDPMKRTIERAR